MSSTHTLIRPIKLHHMLAHQKNYDITERYLIKSSLPKHCVKPYLFVFGSGGVNYYISFLHISGHFEQFMFYQKIEIRIGTFGSGKLRPPSHRSPEHGTRWTKLSATNFKCYFHKWPTQTGLLENQKPSPSPFSTPERFLWHIISQRLPFLW